MFVKPKRRDALEVDIRHERIKRDMKLREVAAHVGVTVATISDIERGRSKPSYDLYLKLMSLFGFDVPRLVFGEAGGEPSNPGESIADAREKDGR